MATETGGPDNLTVAPPSPLGGALENVEAKAEKVEVAEHEKIGHAPDADTKELNMCLAEGLLKSQDVPEGKQIDAAAEPKEDEKPYKLTPDESAAPKAGTSKNLVQPDPDESGPEAATTEKLAEPHLDESVPEAVSSEMEAAIREDTDELNLTDVSAITKDQREPDTDESASEAAVREDQIEPDVDDSTLTAATDEKLTEHDLDELVPEEAASVMEENPDKEQVKLEIVEEKSEENVNKIDEPEPVVEIAKEHKEASLDIEHGETAIVEEKEASREVLLIEDEMPNEPIDTQEVNDAYEIIVRQDKRESDPEEEVESRGQSYVSMVVEEIEPKETLEALLRKEKENHGEVIEAIASESCDKDVTQSSAPEEKLEKNEERTEVDMLKKDPEPNGAIKNADERKEKTPVKTVTKQSNNIIAKVKHSLVKARKAIIAKSPSFKVISTDARG